MDINQALDNLITAIAQRERAKLLALFTDGMPGPVKARATNGHRKAKTNVRARNGSSAAYVAAAIRYIAANPGCAAGDVVRAVKWSRSKPYLMLRVRQTGQVRLVGDKRFARYYPKG